MSTDKNDKDQFQRYLTGKMSNAEAHAFEREVLNDPFAQEASEGFEEHDSEQVFSDIEKLQSRISSEKKTGFSLMRMAAVVSLLTISSLALWLLVGSLDQDEELAIETEVVEERAEEIEVQQNSDTFYRKDTVGSIAETKILAEANVSEVQETDTNESVTEEKPIQIAEAEESQVAINEVPSEVQTDALIADVILEESTVTLQNSASFEADDTIAAFEDDGDVEAEVTVLENQSLQAAGAVSKSFAIEETKSKRDEQAGQKKEVARLATRPAAARARSSLLNNSRTISGTITDDFGEALPGVNVVIKGSTTGTVSDFAGKYQLQTVEGATLEFLSVGFASQEVEIGNSDTLDLQLGSAMTELSEVVVTGYGESEPQGELYSPAEPINKAKTYKQYIKDNLQYPNAARINQIEGVVALELTISATGEIANINVKRSLGYGCDEEAIRLVRNGPDWSPALRNNIPEQDKVRVRVRFKEE
ncbi:MAG: TonB family protein [Cyclobacteriaceae bacterium]